MARPGAPWYWKAKKRWAATIRGRQVAAPREIDKDDRIAAMEWYTATVRAAAVAEAEEAELTVAEGLDDYLLACRDRVAAGDMAADSLRMLTSIMTIACRVAVDGGPFHTMAAAAVDRRTLDAVIANWSSGHRLKVRGAGPRHLAVVRCRLQAAFR